MDGIDAQRVDSSKSGAPSSSLHHPTRAYSTSSSKEDYAGGDAVTGAATVISAMGAGKVAAKAIDEALK